VLTVVKILRVRVVEERALGSDAARTGSPARVRAREIRDRRGPDGLGIRELPRLLRPLSLLDLRQKFESLARELVKRS